MATTQDLMKARLAELEAEKQALKAKSAELREAREKACAEASEANARAIALTAKIHEIERPRLLEISAEMSRVSLALGYPRMGG